MIRCTVETDEKVKGCTHTYTKSCYRDEAFTILREGYGSKVFYILWCDEIDEDDFSKKVLIEKSKELCAKYKCETWATYEGPFGEEACGCFIWDEDENKVVVP